MRGGSRKEKVAKELLRIRAVFLRPDEPFVWSAGILSPIYCDNRLVLSDPEARDVIADGLESLIREEYPDCEALAGTATAGIAHAALAADRLRLPMAYVRPTAKEHGRNNQIEGRLCPGQKTVIVEDLISTARSAVEVANVLRGADIHVLGIASIFTYGMEKGFKRLTDAEIQNESLTDFDTLLRVAEESGYIRREDVAKLLRFRDNPEDDGWRNA